MKDFFISYNRADREWAEWIAWQLEEAGYTTVLQAWDFRPGSNFVHEMHLAASKTQRTIAVLSPDYLEAAYTQPEWEAAFAQDPTGVKGILLPVRVRECELKGLLMSIIYFDLFGLEEKAAKAALLKGMEFGRVKPKLKPFFPQKALYKSPRFPGALPPVWNVPHYRNPSFTGRKQILKKLRKAITSKKSAALTQAIHGLGGVGKTQLALEYAYRYSPEYDIVWWLRSEDTLSLASDYASLAAALDLPLKEAPEQDIIIQAVKQWLGRNKAWLLIFDNAQKQEDIRFYLPQGFTGHIIITSRNPGWRGIAGALTINKLAREESIEFLCKRTEQNDKAAARALAEELGDLPLALEQAGAYIEATGQNISYYLNLFQEHQRELLAYGQPSPEYPDTVATTWELAFNNVKEQSPAGADILNICAFLAPDDIPRKLFIEKVENVPDSLTRAFANSLTFDAAIAALRSYSLIEARSDMLSVHQLVQAVARDRLQENEKKSWAEVAVRMVANIFPFESEDVRTWSKCAALLPHAKAAIGNIEKLMVELEVTARLLNQIALYLEGRAAYAEAEPLYRRALEIYEAQLGKDHPHVAHSLNNLAELFRVQGKYAEAEPLFRRALEIRERQLGEDHPYVAASLNNLAVLFRAQGKHAEAEPLYRRALEIREAQLGKDHPDVALSLNNLAELFHAQGKYAEAEPLYRRALEIYEAQLGEDHPDVAQSLNNLAELFRVQGKYTEAEPLHRRALEIRERQLGEDHPDIAQSLNNLALLFHAQGKYAEAEPLYLRALEISEAQLGKDHPNTEVVRNNLIGLLDSA